MKMILQLFSFISYVLLFTFKSSAVPLHGTYTIGTGGNYPEIRDAIAAVDSLVLKFGVWLWNCSICFQR